VNNALLLNGFICFTGLALHFAMKWLEARNALPTNPPGMFAYIASVPAQSLISLLATVAVFTVMSAMEWMNPGAAFASGYMGNSLAENLASKYSKLP
jgi:hypothetical protein